MNMKVFGMVAAMGLGVAAFTSGCCTATKCCATPDSSDWEDVFAKDLSNADFEPGSWEWNKDGYLVPITGETLFSKKDYANYVLDVEYIMEPTANSGLFLYDSRHPTHKFEVQILDDAHPKYVKEKPYQNTGAIYGRLAPSKVCSKPAGELNRMVCHCMGSKIKVFVNGEKVVDTDLAQWTDPATNPDGTSVPPWHKNFPALGTIPMHGRIALQGVHGGKKTYFKSLKVKEMK